MSRTIKSAIWGSIGLGGMVAVTVILLLTFDWNRVKPWIETKVRDASGRSFAIDGELSLRWHAAQGETGLRRWIPWPRLIAQDVRLGNPAWAKAAHMAQAGQISFSIRPLALLERRIVIPNLSLDTPQLVLERQRDGRNNWTFEPVHAETEWQLEVQRLTFHEGSVHWTDQARRAQLTAALTTLDGDDLYRTQWTLEGRFNGEAVRGSGKAGDMLSLQGKGVPFPIKADIRAGRTVIEVNGALTDPGALKALDVQLKVSGISMAQLYPLTGLVLPETPPFSIEGRLSGEPGRHGGNWTYDKFHGKFGNSDIAGTLHYRERDNRESRPLVEGRVRSNHLSFKDLRPLLGLDSAASKTLRGSKTVQPAGKLLPVEPFRAKRWTSVDANVQFHASRIVHGKELPITQLSSPIRLQDGVLSFAPLQFHVAGGELVSTLSLNGKQNQVRANLRLSVRHLQLKQLFTAMRALQSSLGELNGDAVLNARGNSIAELAASANGKLKGLVHQGSLSKLMLEQLGLNLGSIVVTQLFGDKQVAMHCAAADFQVLDGVMQSRAFVIDTEDAHIAVQGDIDLSKEKFSLTLKPHAKGFRLFSLRSPVYVKGTFQQPTVEIDKGILALKAGSALALSTLAPLTALIPLVQLGPEAQSECASLLRQASPVER